MDLMNIAKHSRWFVLALAFAAGLSAAWPWLGRTADERAADALLSGLVKVTVRPAFADCPPEIYERFRRLFQRTSGVKESAILVDSMDDEAVVSLIRNHAASASKPEGIGTSEEAVILGMCVDNAVRLLAVDAANGAVLRMASAPLVGEPLRGQAHLHVTSRPTGAELSLDHQVVGTTPLLLVNIAPGTHQLRLKHALYRRAEEQVTLAAGATTSRLYALQSGEGRIAVVTHPSGAEIVLDGHVQTDTTPTVLGPLRSGEHRLELRKKPFPPIHTTAAVPAGLSANMHETFPGASPERSRPPWRDPVTGMEFLWVAGGCYEMGCGPWTDDCDPDEVVHTVCVDGFWMGKFEVTQEQWHRVMGANPSSLNRSGNRPVNHATWNDAQIFLRRLNSRGQDGFRLPTEAEWEYACRSGGRPEKFAGGDEATHRRLGLGYVKELAWVGEGWGAGPFPVGKKAPNGLGIYDMSGNMWEWVADDFVVDGYAKHAPKNPWLKEGRTARVARGGSWFNHSRLVRCSHRYRFNAEFGNADLGFRVVRMSP